MAAIAGRLCEGHEALPHAKAANENTSRFAVVTDKHTPGVHSKCAASVNAERADDTVAMCHCLQNYNVSN